MQITENTNPLSYDIRTKIELYRKQLISAGMTEPIRRESSCRHCYFYKPTTALTAFIVNLHSSKSHIEVTYGYASTAFTRLAGDENTLTEFGVSDEDITIREKIIIRDEADEFTAKFRINKLHSRYLATEKDELLLIAKAMRKEFIQQIACKLKPLKFKKKGNTWTRALDENFYLMFNAQKSSFSDEYYFNIYIGKNGTDHYGDCYYTRVAPNGMFPMDWQTLSKGEFDSFLDLIVTPALEHIVNTPLHELGKSPSVWSCCSCDRHKCEQCWVEKNLWEVKEN